MTQLELTCLGDFQVTLAGTLLTAFQTDKTRALLVYLTLEPQVHQRQELAQFLWPGYSAESARNSLRQALHQLRHLLQDDQADPPWLLLTRQTVQFNPAASLQVDVVTFNGLLAAATAHAHTQITTCAPCLARLRQAVDLYRGDFLAGFTVADSDPFEEWRRIMQEQLHLQALDALTSLAEAAEMAGDIEQALQDAQRQLALEPWLEIAHRRIMRLLAQRGQRIAALAQYNRCRQVLAEEFGVSPDPATTTLFEEIQRGELDGLLRQAARERGSGGQPAPSPKATLDSPLNQWRRALAQQKDEVTRGRVAYEADTVVPRANDKTNSNADHPVIPSPSHNLPAVLTPLIGRNRDLTEIAARLQQPSIRLLTLVGPGGTGKTRLAIAAAASLTTHFATGVCMVELAELTDPALLPQTVAAALGQTDRADPAGEDVVTSYLRQQQVLLVLDNCEHLSEAAAHWCKRWLSACPDLSILATSHGALNVTGEHVWPVPTLAYPPPGADLSPDQLLEFDAVKLFVARAQEIKADFALTAINGSAIAQICRRLEGIPLALELAAARVKLLTPAEIAARLSQSVDAAIAANRSAPARHQTMRAALDWSFDLLDGDEQALFQRLALFSGGFSLHALETVADLPDTLSVLSRLIDRSLVTTETLGDQTRYRMRGIIREYAYDKLMATGEAQGLRRRHIAYFLRLTEQAQMDPQADGEALWLQPEAENLSSAIDWALTNGNVGAAVRLAGALTWYWWMRGHLRARRAPLQQALAQLDSPLQDADAGSVDPITSERAMLTFATGALFALWEEPVNAWLAFTQALALAEAAQNQQIVGLALRRLAEVAIGQKAYGAANDFIVRGLAVWQSLGGIWHIAWLYAHQGDLAYERGDQTQAWLAYEASTKLPVHPGARAYPLRRMAYLALNRGDHSQALALCHESLSLNLASGDRQGIAACFVGVAHIRVVYAQTLPSAPHLPLLRHAAQLLGAVEALLQTVEGRLLKADELVYQQTARLLHEQLNRVLPTTYDAALAAGRSMSVAQATDLALQAEDVATVDFEEWL